MPDPNQDRRYETAMQLGRIEVQIEDLKRAAAKTEDELKRVNDKLDHLQNLQLRVDGAVTLMRWLAAGAVATAGFWLWAITKIGSLLK